MIRILCKRKQLFSYLLVCTYLRIFIYVYSSSKDIFLKYWMSTCNNNFRIGFHKSKHMSNSGVAAV